MINTAKDSNLNEPIISTVLTEDTMVCYDCIWRGAPAGYPSGRCIMFQRKPFAVLGKDHDGICPSYEQEK